MINRRALYLDDPEDLGQWSSGAFVLFLQIERLDFARRYYKRQGDKTSLKRSDEIKKLMNKIADLQTQAVLSLVTEEIMTRHWKSKEASHSKYYSK